MMTRIGRLRDPEVIADVNAAVNYARRLKDTQLGDVGIIGFCMGGPRRLPDGGLQAGVQGGGASSTAATS